MESNYTTAQLIHPCSHLLPPTWSPQDGTLLDLPPENILYNNLENWLDTGRRLTKTARQDRLLFHFAIGDWYNCGIRSLGIRAVKAAKALPHVSYAAIRQCAYVAQRFPTDFRTIELPWNLYRQLAPEPEDVRFPFLEQVLNGDVDEEESNRQLKEMRLRRLSSRSEKPGNLRQCLTPSESCVRAGGRSAEGHTAADLGPTAVAGPCADNGAASESANLRQCLTPPSPESGLTTHDSRLTTPALAAWIRSNYSADERLHLIKTLLAQVPQQVKDKLAMELIGSSDKPCLLRLSRETWADWCFLADQLDQDIGIVANRLKYHAHRVYGPTSGAADSLSPTHHDAPAPLSRSVREGAEGAAPEGESQRWRKNR